MNLVPFHSFHLLTQTQGGNSVRMAHPQLAHSVAPELNCSPTTTPFQTRAASPVHYLPDQHPQFEPEVAIDSMRSFIQSRILEKVDVSSVDGSATVSNSSKSQALALYFVFNLGLTLFNKAAMNKVWNRGASVAISSKFAVTLSWRLHILCLAKQTQDL